MTAICRLTKPHILPWIEGSQYSSEQQSPLQQPPQQSRNKNIETARDTKNSTAIATTFTTYTTGLLNSNIMFEIVCNKKSKLQ